jgi:hypothetical protein
MLIDIFNSRATLIVVSMISLKLNDLSRDKRYTQTSIYVAYSHCLTDNNTLVSIGNN